MARRTYGQFTGLGTKPCELITIKSVSCSLAYVLTTLHLEPDNGDPMVIASQKAYSEAYQGNTPDVPYRVLLYNRRLKRV